MLQIYSSIVDIVTVPWLMMLQESTDPWDKGLKSTDKNGLGLYILLYFDYIFCPEKVI